MATGPELHRRLLHKLAGQEAAEARSLERATVLDELDSIHADRRKVLGRFALFMHAASTPETKMDDPDHGLILQVQRSKRVPVTGRGSGVFVTGLQAYSEDQTPLNRNQLEEASAMMRVERVIATNVFRYHPDNSWLSDSAIVDDDLGNETFEVGPALSIRPNDTQHQGTVEVAKSGLHVLQTGLAVFVGDARNFEFNPEMAELLDAAQWPGL